MHSFIGSTEAAKILDIDKSTLTRWVHAGRLPLAGRASDKPNGALFFKRSDVEALAEEMRTQAVAS